MTGATRELGSETHRSIFELEAVRTWEQGFFAPDPGLKCSSLRYESFAFARTISVRAVVGDRGPVARDEKNVSLSVEVTIGNLAIRFDSSSQLGFFSCLFGCFFFLLGCTFSALCFDLFWRWSVVLLALLRRCWCWCRSLSASVGTWPAC